MSFMKYIFKIGDKVKVIDNTGAKSSYIGQMLTITSITKLTNATYLNFKEVPFALKTIRVKKARFWCVYFS